jgi:hypothetical protein
MIGQIFLIIQILMRAFGLWDQFISWSDAQREKDRIEQDQKRNAAVDQQSNAQSEADFDKSQDTIVGNKP